MAVKVRISESDIGMESYKKEERVKGTGNLISAKYSNTTRTLTQHGQSLREYMYVHF